jgi:hypothetical protein
MRAIKINLIFQILFLFLSNAIVAQRIFYCGIPNSKMGYCAAVQEKPQWCWAASIQMVMNYYGVDIDQQQIVKRTYGTTNGELPDWAASIEIIHKNLNYTGIDKKGNRYIVNAKVGLDVPDPVLLINELSQKRPVVIAYKSNLGGHVVLITAVSYYESSRGPMIRTIVVRDPLPEVNNQFENGRIEYEASTLAKFIQAYWLVRVHTDEYHQ